MLTLGGNELICSFKSYHSLALQFLLFVSRWCLLLRNYFNSHLFILFSFDQASFAPKLFKYLKAKTSFPGKFAFPDISLSTNGKFWGFLKADLSWGCGNGTRMMQRGTTRNECQKYSSLIINSFQSLNKQAR